MELLLVCIQKSWVICVFRSLLMFVVVYFIDSCFLFFALPYFNTELRKLSLNKKKCNPILIWFKLGDFFMFQKNLSIFFFLKSLVKVLPKAEWGIGRVGNLEKVRFSCSSNSTRLKWVSISLRLLAQRCFDKHLGFRFLNEPLIVWGSFFL